MTVDREGLILESDETDNVAYALVRIIGESVELIERGYGTDHLDPDKVIATDHRGSRAPVPFTDRVVEIVEG